MTKAERLDRLLVARGLAETRALAHALVLAGRVTSRGVRMDKAGTRLAPDAPLEVRPGPRWVGRGGRKLAWAVEALGLAIRDRDALDVGASTGGFTEVLLASGARRVAAVDVGRGQLHWSLRNDPRVHVVDGVNARYLEPSALPFRPDVAVVDVSFISVILVLPSVAGCLAPGGEALVLVKPQFEVGRGRVGRGGIVRDPALHAEVLRNVAGFCGEKGWGVRRVVRCPVHGAEGNVEFFVQLAFDAAGADRPALEREIAAAAAAPSEEPA